MKKLTNPMQIPEPFNFLKHCYYKNFTKSMNFMSKKMQLYAFFNNSWNFANRFYEDWMSDPIVETGE